jgi:hypothetical protein
MNIRIQMKHVFYLKIAKQKVKNSIVFDFDNTITGSDNILQSPKNFHLWKIMYGKHKIFENTYDWDEDSKFIIKQQFNSNKENNCDVKKFANATSLVTYFMGGQHRLTRFRIFFEALSKKANIYISSNGDTQMIYYFLVNANLIKYISGIHGRMYNDKERQGCFLSLKDEYDIDPFDVKYCQKTSGSKKIFMEKLLNKFEKILFVDDNDEDIINEKIIVFKHNEFKHEGYGLNIKCCFEILNFKF